MSRPETGLCDRCRHQRIVRNTRGSTFSLCERSKDDPHFPKYPRIPVVACPGYEPRAVTTGPADGRPLPAGSPPASVHEPREA